MKKKTVSFWHLSSSTLKIWECRCYEHALADEMEESFPNAGYKTNFFTKEEAEAGRLHLIDLMKKAVSEGGRDDLRQTLEWAGV